MSHPMLFIYDTGIDLSAFGGAITHVLEKSAALSQCGVRVDLLCLRAPDAPPGDRVTLRQFGLARGREPGYLNYARYEFSTFFYVLGSPRKGTVLLVRQRIFGLLPIVAAFLRRIPVIYEVNNNEFDQMRLSGKLNLPKRCFMHAVFYAASHLSSMIFALTGDIGRYVARVFHVAESKIRVIPVGCNIGIFHPMDPADCRRRLGMGAGFRYLINVSTFQPWSGIPFLLGIVRRLVENNRNIKLILVGDGYLMGHFKSLVRDLGIIDNVVFAGKTPYSEVPYYINASDICFCVKSEDLLTTSPTRLFEYLGCAKPVFVTQGYKDALGLESLIAVSESRVAESADMILALLNDDKRRKELGDISHDYAVKNASWGAIAKSIIAAIGSRQES